jgi:chemotaxis protein MotB
LKYLIDVKDIPPQKLSSLGKGEYEPIASNDTAEGRAQNRRVEIKIYNELSQITN